MNRHDRRYILRFERDGESEYLPVHLFDVPTYSCGLKTGDQLVLKADLQITDSEDQATSFVSKGSVWEVLPGSSQDPGCLWLEQPSGDLHSWDDNDSIFEVFERL